VPKSTWLGLKTAVTQIRAIPRTVNLTGPALKSTFFHFEAEDLAESANR
jgi:hypothetical protein